MAELMLRRTRADQVARVYDAFLAKYPTLAAAASADSDDIRAMLYPLGLAWRAEGVIRFLRAAHERFGEDIPTDAASLRTLPGVGDYVSAAVQCFAGGAHSVLVDVNVVRVLGRYFGISTAGEARRARPMIEMAARAADTVRCADYHYALLDFAAGVCIPKKPRCGQCPFSHGGNCDYFERVVKFESVRSDNPGGDPTG